MGSKHTEEDTNKLTTVHEALSEATQESRSRGRHHAMETVTFKAPIELKHQCMEICLHNGTELSTFLRHCLEGLVRDYSPRRREADQA